MSMMVSLSPAYCSIYSICSSISRKWRAELGVQAAQVDGENIFCDTYVTQASDGATRRRKQIPKGRKEKHVK